MIVMDLAQPAEICRARHKVISLFIPRTRVQAVIGDIANLAGRQLAPTRGCGYAAVTYAGDHGAGAGSAARTAHHGVKYGH